MTNKAYPRREYPDECRELVKALKAAVNCFNDDPQIDADTALAMAQKALENAAMVSERETSPLKHLERQFTLLGIICALLAVILIVEWMCR